MASAHGDPAGPSATGPAPADVEMVAESSGTGAAAAGTGDHPQPQPQPQDPERGHGWSHWAQLALAKRLLREGKTALALQAVTSAGKANGGEDAAAQVFHFVRELCESNTRENAAAADLASLFAQFSIAEVHPSGATETTPEAVAVGGGSILLPKIEEGWILAESGRGQIVLDAVSDGSNFLCFRCGGLVSNQRRAEHAAYWCPGRI